MDFEGSWKDVFCDWKIPDFITVNCSFVMVLRYGE
jgi:hypothetical protein